MYQVIKEGFLWMCYSVGFCMHGGRENEIFKVSVACSNLLLL